MSGTRRAFAVVVVNYDSADLIDRNYASVPFDRLGGSLVVVDNRKSADATAAITELCARHGWDLLVNETNEGFGAAMNAGVASAQALGCDVVVLANPDLRLESAVLEELVRSCRQEPLTALSPRVVRDTGAVWFSGGTVLVDEGRTSTRPGVRSDEPDGWLSGACLAVHTELWDRSGGFDDDYFLYWEDVDLSWRFVAAGGRLAVREDLTVVHSVGGTQHSRGKSPTYVYYNCRNRLLFAARHLNHAQQRNWARRSFRYARAVAQRGGRRDFLAHALPLTGAAVRGTLAGLKLLRRARAAGRRLVVLQSFPGVGRETNPYLIELASSVSAAADVRYFSWAYALLGRYDVLHVHWPERLIRSERPLAARLRPVLFALLLVRIALTRAVVVRTVHNLASHEEGRRTEQLLVAALDRLTARWIRLNPFTPVPVDAPVSTIKHGDYRSWFAAHPRPDRVPGRILHFGLIRGYKGVDELLAAFAGLEDPRASLHVVGKAGRREPHLRALAEADPRVVLSLGYADDAALARELGEAELVVLPYRAVHNSGSALLALSLDRPVLMPDDVVVRWLQDEVGAEWVLPYAPPLTSEVLAAARVAVAGRGSEAAPLAGREWPTIGAQHVDVYREAVKGRRAWRRGVVHPPVQGEKRGPDPRQVRLALLRALAWRPNRVGTVAGEGRDHGSI